MKFQNLKMIRNGQFNTFETFEYAPWIVLKIVFTKFSFKTIRMIIQNLCSETILMLKHSHEEFNVMFQLPKPLKSVFTQGTLKC